ncbi:MAG: nitrogenase-stabilizing/protective protein NifW [Leptolyngbyaceae cyanobacterium bins.59]|nr:nitrogenase-stabilizing/protective protein NifW [Leptolyngbyaceae cyanobacterium bins.59]
MSGTVTEFKQLVNAEDYFIFFNLPYDPQIVNVNRLHILKKFSNAVKEIDAEFAGVEDEEKLARYERALQNAYEVFLSSTGVEQKLFKVFKKKPQGLVMLSDIGNG